VLVNGGNFRSYTHSSGIRINAKHCRAATLRTDINVMLYLYGPTKIKNQ